MSGNITQHAPLCRTRDVDDVSWLISSGMLVLSMQAGFALLEAGVVRNIHAANIMMKNILDLCIAAISWWALGWGIAFGEDWGGFVGTDQFFGNGVKDVSLFFFQFTFSATVSTIDSGSVAERMRFLPYILLSMWMTTITYPFVVHWAWAKGGFLSEMGYVDLAGSGVVHLSGAASGLVASWWLGPRVGRFAPRVELAPGSPGRPKGRALASTGRMGTIRDLLSRDKRRCVPNDADSDAQNSSSVKVLPTLEDAEERSEQSPTPPVPRLKAKAMNRRRESEASQALEEPEEELAYDDSHSSEGMDSDAVSRSQRRLVQAAEQIDPVQRRVSAWEAAIEEQKRKLKRPRSRSPVRGKSAKVFARGSGHGNVVGARRSERYVVTRGIGMPSFPAGDPISQLFGCFLLWLGWYGFNCGSTLGLGHGLHSVASTVAICTTLAAAAGGITGALIASHYVGVATVESTCCGILAGLVAVTAGPHVILPGESIVVGAVGSLLCYFSRQMLIRLRIDDPVEAISIHGTAAIWGVLSVGLFADTTDCGFTIADHNSKGVFHGGSARLLGVQMIGILVIIVWAVVNTAIFFALCSKIGPRMRASQQELALGLDVIEHGVESTGALAQKLAHVHTLLATMPPQDRMTMHHAIEALLDPIHGGQHAANNDHG